MPSIIYVLDEDNRTPLVGIYDQDGESPYREAVGHAHWLWLQKRVLTDCTQNDCKFSNGMGELAAHLVFGMKHESLCGGIYLSPTPAPFPDGTPRAEILESLRNFAKKYGGPSYVYVLSGNTAWPGTFRMAVIDVYGSGVIFDGTLPEMADRFGYLDENAPDFRGETKSC